MLKTAYQHLSTAIVLISTGQDIQRNGVQQSKQKVWNGIVPLLPDAKKDEWNWMG